MINPKEIKKKRDEFLLTMYRLSEGQADKTVLTEDVAKAMKIDYGTEASAIGRFLGNEGLITWNNFTFTALTHKGILEVEKITEQTYKEKEYLVLKQLYENTRFNDQKLNSEEIAQSASILKDEVDYILLDFKRKEWVWLMFGMTAQISPQGVTAFQTWESDSSNKQVGRDYYETHIYGNSSNNIGGQNNIQNAINSPNMNIDDKTKNRYRVLEEIYQLSDANSVEIVVIDQIEKNTQISTHEMNGILSYLESKGLIDFEGGDIVQITSRGIDEIEQARRHPEEKTDNFPPQITYITNVQGDFYGGLQQGGEGNTQNNQVNVNPDFNNIIKELIDLVNNSDLHILQKEERLAEIDRIQQLAQREQTPEVQELGQSKVKLLETGLKVGELAIKAAPLIEKIAAVFGG